MWLLIDDSTSRRAAWQISNQQKIGVYMLMINDQQAAVIQCISISYSHLPKYLISAQHYCVVALAGC
jgi:hypothetical protein